MHLHASGKTNIFNILGRSEIAYFNKRSKQDDVKKIIPLFNDSKKLLISLLTGNTFINISLASIATLFTISLVDTLGLNQYYLIFLQIFVVSILILIFGEIIPKIIAMRDSEYFAKRTHLIIKLLAKIFYPIALIFYTITNANNKRKTKFKKTKTKENKIKK